MSDDPLRWPVVGPLLRARHGRFVLQAPLVLVCVALVLHGFLGPTLAPKNLATTLVWVHYRGALVFALLILGNVFCTACPFQLPRNLARRWIRPRRRWPRALRNKWLAAGLFVALLFAYEAADLWASPVGTAALILVYFAAALAVDLVFDQAPFCKWVCPIGQFNFVASTLSPRELRVRDAAVCDACATKDCVRGRHIAVRGRALPVLQPGCELALALPRKVGNLDCTLCLDCVRACPHDNIALAARPPAAELFDDPFRSGIGRLSRRPDLAALCTLFTFGALLNAFGMVRPVYTVLLWLAQRLHLHHEAGVLAILFALGLIVAPVLCLGGAAALTDRRAVLATAIRFAYCLVPLGFTVWLAHYGFHFLTGFWTFVPVLQSALIDLGIDTLGPPRWGLSGLSPALVYPIELGVLTLGLLGSCVTARRIAGGVRAALPWWGLSLLLWGCALWLMSQPMEMRGTFLNG